MPSSFDKLVANVKDALVIRAITDRAIALQIGPRRTQWVPKSVLGRIEYWNGNATYEPVLGDVQSIEIERWFTKKEDL